MKKKRTVGEGVALVLQEMFVKIKQGEEFKLPLGIVNYHTLEDADVLRCELAELRKEAQAGIQLVEKDVLVEVVKVSDHFYRGVIPKATCNLYEMRSYNYALLKIKEVIRRR